MQSVVEEIKKLRGNRPVNIDSHNSNRYRLVCYEDDGTKTAYYFSTPIYNNTTRRMITPKFSMEGQVFRMMGSNAHITVSDLLLLENAEGAVSVELSEKVFTVSKGKLQCGEYTVFPTVNGVAISVNVSGENPKDFTLEIGQPHLATKSNDRCFAVMKEEFRPLCVISCIGATDFTGNVIAPARMSYQKLSDKKYRISFASTSSTAHKILLEINMYENKLFQDTTVESANPTTNNVFGSISFIGNSTFYGEQWLYTRLDNSKMPEMMDKRIHKVLFHMPKLNQSDVELSAFKVSARFCSFGSTWDNKIAEGAPVSDSLIGTGYQSIDITSLFVEPRTRTLSRSEGMILKSQIKDSGFSVIATSDSYLAPQILEINYR